MPDRPQDWQAEVQDRIEGDLEIRPSRPGFASAIIVTAIFLFAWASSASLARAAVFAGAALLLIVICEAYPLVSRVRVVGDSLEVRTLWKRVAVPLAHMAPAVRSKVLGSTSLHLRLHGGSHLQTLGIPWAADSLNQLGARLGAVQAQSTSFDQLEREFPGACGWAARNHVLVIILIVAAACGLVAAILRPWT